MLVASNVTSRFLARELFEIVSGQFGEGNRGLIDGGRERVLTLSLS
jgi:hypothetical protein